MSRTLLQGALVVTSLGTDVDSVVPGEIVIAARVALAHQRGLDHEHRQQSTGVLSMERQSPTSRRFRGRRSRERARLV